MRVLSGTPEGALLGRRRLVADAPELEPRGHEGVADAALDIPRPRDRAARASSPSSWRSTSRATTSPTRTRPATRRQTAVLRRRAYAVPGVTARRRPASSAPASTSRATSASATTFLDIQYRAQTMRQGVGRRPPQDGLQPDRGRLQRAVRQRPQLAAAKLLVGVAERLERTRGHGHPPGARPERREPRERLPEPRHAAHDRPVADRPERHRHDLAGQLDRHPDRAAQRRRSSTRGRRRHAERPARPARRR